jgi:DNA-binding transcriptional LysR family regulator
MRLSLRQLQIFFAVARTGSTTAAAELVALSQSATSAALNELESVLDARLFDRVGKRLILNDNGRLLLPQAQRMLDTAAAIEQQFAYVDQAGASLHLGASTTIGNYLLPALLAAAFPPQTGTCPKVAIANTADIVSAVANYDIDMGLIEGPSHEPGLRVEPWIRDELIVVCAPDHPILAGAPQARVPLKALRDAGWLLREPGSGTRETVEHLLRPHLHYVRAAGEFGSAEAIKHAAAEGLGIACLSRYVVDDLLAVGRLVEARTTLPVLSRHFYLIHAQHKILSVRLQHFLEFCRRWRG